MKQAVCVFSAIFFSIASLKAGFAETTHESIPIAPPLFDGLDGYQMKISTQSKKAQQYFNQGLVLYYGFNFPEACRSFREAARQDPKSPMCCWGEALALGECIQSPGDPWCVQAYHAIQQARQLTHFAATGKERALITALSKRYQKQEHNYGIDDNRYIAKMKTLCTRYPDDPDITVVCIKTYMDNVDMYAGMQNGNPTGATKEILTALENGLKKHPWHPGLNHLHIHALEACGTPKKALETAERLDGLVPGSGHLQHMPAHTYFHVGRYHDASEANQRGIDADDNLFQQGGIKISLFAGFYLHNYYYLFHSLTMEGRSSDSLEAARKVIAKLKSHELPASPYLQDVFHSVPYFLMARFGKWEEINKEPPPPKELLFSQGAWEYAKGLAAIRSEKTTIAEQLLQQLEQTKLWYTQKNQVEGFYDEPLVSLLNMAYLDLSGEIAAAKGNHQQHIENLLEAVQIEDTLYLGMQPWYLFARHALGAAYLKAGMPQKAERVYLEDLEIHPNNGWALAGLIKSLKAQGKTSQLRERKRVFERTWEYADVTLESSRY